MQAGKVKANDFAILTTRFPEYSGESQRRIFGVFQIGEIKDVPNSETMLSASQKGRVPLRRVEADELFFWKYCTTASTQPDWRTGLFRYLDDTQVHQLLVDMVAIIQDSDRKAIVNDFITQAFGRSFAYPL